MKINWKFPCILGLALVLLAGLSGCLPVQKAGLTDQKVASVTENLLKAINDNDYPAFSHDFGPEMKTALPQDKFPGLRAMLAKSSGNFISITGAPSLSNSQGYVIYRFQTKYEKESVIVTVTFAIGGQQVEGLFFNSPNLRKASQ